MGDISRYLANKLLDHALKNTAYTRPAALYLALLDSAPANTDTGATIPEVSGGNYARKALPAFTTASGRVTSNSTGLALPEVTVSLGIVSHFAILDTITLTTGNVLAFGAVSPARLCDAGANPNILTGDIDVSFNANGLSDYLANKLLDHVFKGAAFSQPVTLYVALSTGAIVDASTGTTITEPGDSYARQAVSGFSAASAGASANSADILFPAATASQGSVASFALLDALATGNLFFHAALTTARAIGAGDVPKIPTGALSVTLG